MENYPIAITEMDGHSLLDYGNGKYIQLSLSLSIGRTAASIIIDYIALIGAI